MLIDWFTLLAEIVNFLILIFLLKRFLYDRIIDIAEAREAEIAARYEEAEETRKQAEEKAEAYRAERQELDEQRDTLLTEAREAAEERRRELVAEARSDVEQREAEWQHTLIREKERFLRELYQLAGQHVYAAARRALADLADRNLEQQVVRVFLDRLANLGAEERAALLDSLEESNAQIRTAFPLGNEEREKIEQALDDEFEKDVSPEFLVDGDLVCGIALRTNGRQVTWNVSSYLDHLEQEVRDALDDAIDEKAEEMAAEAEEEEEREPEAEEDALEEKIEAAVRDVINEKFAESDERS